MTSKFTPPQALLALFCVVIMAGCTRYTPGKEVSADAVRQFSLFSKTVKDTFFISVQLPANYAQEAKKHYPVVVVTDANFYFPMLAPIVHQYEKGGLLPPMILVSVGYKSLESMQSLRVRDYLYPAAIASDEMKAPGGGLRYYEFLTQELLPVIDAGYRTERNTRTLLGHSFGGYFSLLALQQQISFKRNDFKGFVSASPTLWYNNNYLSGLPKQLKSAVLKDSVSLFLSVGGSETPTEWTVEPVENMGKELLKSSSGKVKLSTTIYNNLDHMDNGLISFIKGLKGMYQKPAR